VTLLDVTQGGGAAGDPSRTAWAAPAAGRESTAGQRSSSGQRSSGGQRSPAGYAQGDDVMMRFGPGVPAETAAAQIWRAGQTAATLEAQQGSGGAARNRRRRRTGWAGTVLLAMLIALVVLWLRQAPGGDMAVRKVDVKAPKKTVRCDGAADFIGVVTTNGKAGTIRFLWIRSDNPDRREQEQRVTAGTTSVSLPLHWKVSGKSSFKGTATLRVLSPIPSGKPLEDRGSFSYKC
jgi:hypothetical protein